MDYNKIKILKLNQCSDDGKDLFLTLAKLLTKTGLYEQNTKVNFPDLNHWEIIIEKFIIPYQDNIYVLNYEGSLIGFYAAKLMKKARTQEDVILKSEVHTTWHNLSSSVMKLYDLHFKDQELVLDNVALIDEFQGRGIFKNVILPRLKYQADELKAGAIALTVFEKQNNPAYQLYLRQGFQEFAAQKYKLEQITHPSFGSVDKVEDKLIFLRLQLSHN